MMTPPIGKTKTSKHQSSLCRVGLLDFKTSTVNALAIIILLQKGKRHTPNNDIEDEDDKAENAASGSILPGILSGSCRDWSGHDAGEESEEDCED